MVSRPSLSDRSTEHQQGMPISSISSNNWWPCSRDNQIGYAGDAANVQQRSSNTIIPPHWRYSHPDTLYGFQPQVSDLSNTRGIFSSYNVGGGGPCMPSLASQMETFSNLLWGPPPPYSGQTSPMESTNDLKDQMTNSANTNINNTTSANKVNNKGDDDSLKSENVKGKQCSSVMSHSCYDETVESAMHIYEQLSPVRARTNSLPSRRPTKKKKMCRDTPENSHNFDILKQKTNSKHYTVGRSYRIGSKLREHNISDTQFSSFDKKTICPNPSASSPFDHIKFASETGMSEHLKPCTSADNQYAIRADQIPIISSNIIEEANKKLLGLPSSCHRQFPIPLSCLISPQHKGRQPSNNCENNLVPHNSILPALISPMHNPQSNYVNGNFFKQSKKKVVSPIKMYPTTLDLQNISNTEAPKTNTNNLVYLRPEQNIPETFNQDKFRPIMPASSIGSDVNCSGNCESPSSSVSSDDIVVTLRSVKV